MSQIRHENMFFDEYVENGQLVVELVKCVKTKIEEHLEIPHTVNGRPVRRIGMAAFRDNKRVKSIKCPDSVGNIYGYAFARCINLEKFEVYATSEPASYLNVANNVFEGCEKLSIFRTSVPVRHIGSMAFTKCSALATVDAKVQVLGHKVFAGCDLLSSITIDDNGCWEVDSFIRAKKLKDLHFLGTINVYKSSLNVVAKKNLHCTDKFNHFELAYEGTRIEIT